MECLPADKPRDVVSVTRRNSGVAPRACVRVYTRVLVPPNLYIHIHTWPADKPWDVVSETRRSSGVAPRACVRVYARVLVPPNLYIHTYTQPGGWL